MKAAIPIGKVAGIPVRIHLSFLLAVGWIAWLGWKEGGLQTSLWAASLILLLFGCVVLHELGHSLVAVAFGSKVRSVTLYPVGGVAGLENMPQRPGPELVMSLAGPAVNVIIAAVLVWHKGGFPGWDTSRVFPSSTGELREALIRANIVLAAFNLLPAFPMDGGRVLRSLLALVVPYARATAVAAAIGQALAIGLLLLGLAVSNPFLAIIGLFVFFGAGAEERYVRLQSQLSRLSAADAMKRSFVCLKPDDPVGLCVEIARSQKQYYFPVEWEGRIVGLVSREIWDKAVARNEMERPVRELMQKVFVSVEAGAPLDRLYRDLQGLAQGFVPVISEGRIVGILSLDDIADLLTRSSVKPTGPPAPREVGFGWKRFMVDFG